MHLRFRLETETKGALRYQEVLPSGKLAKAPNDPGAKVGIIYFRKSAFPQGEGRGGFPTELEINVTVVPRRMGVEAEATPVPM